jgi:hypothetical protein
MTVSSLQENRVYLIMPSGASNPFRGLTAANHRH